MRAIKKIHTAVYAPIADLITHRAIPTSSIDYLDPFLFLNHHGPQTYKKNNGGLPFGPHPHRGFETLTYVIKGDIAHLDSGGGESVIKEGGIQWMTAGSGLIHSEVSSDEFKKNGGEEEVIQLWMNLKAEHKMVKPNYIGLTKEEITHFNLDEEKVTVDLISGKWGDFKGPVDSLGELTMTSIQIKEGGRLNLSVPEGHEILFYLVKGELAINDLPVKKHQLVQFEMESGEIAIEAKSDAYIIFAHALPFNEPVVAEGPFVMNSEKEIQEAYADYRNGKMGKWN
ncbi:MAG: pirin family protein [Pelobium sp.]